MRARVTSSRFVGRIGELAALERASREAAEQRPVVVLLGGDSGVGKTRLVREFEQRMSDSEAEDVLVLRGEAVEEADGELPYAPLIGALRPLVRSRHPVFDALGRGTRSQLAALLPGIDEEPAVADRNDPSAQLRLFEGLLELFDLLSEDRVLVLTLEDLHWADRSTRTFVDFLARGLRRERVMLLLSYRTDELHRRHPMRSLLAELERLDRVRRVELEPFDRLELAEALADILDETPTDQLVERLYMRSEGNPLYTEELLAAGMDGRGAAPQSLRDAFMLRIERLSPDAQSAARAISAARALDEVTISEVTRIEPDPLHLALREAVAEQVLVAGEDGRLSFRHALLREAMYDDLLPGERSELHLALARALEERGECEDDRGLELTSTVAHHYSVAGDQPAALRATVQAALAAGEVHAYGDAAELAERALDLWPRVPDAAATIPLDHVELLCAGRHGAPPSGRRSSRAPKHCSSGRWASSTRSRTRAATRSLLDDLSRAAVEAQSAAWRRWRPLNGRWRSSRRTRSAASARRCWPGSARTKHLRGRYREAFKEGKVALDAARAAGDRRAESEVLNTLGDVSDHARRRRRRSLARLRAAIEIARTDDDFGRMEGAYSNLAEALSLAGRTLEALEISKEGIAAFAARGARVADWMLLTARISSFESGDWKAAREYLDRPATHPAGTSADLPPATRDRTRARRRRRGAGGRGPERPRAADRALVRAAVDRGVRNAQGRVPAAPRATWPARAPPWPTRSTGSRSAPTT